MNFERKLKLNSLGEYKFSNREKECLKMINELKIQNLDYKKTSFLYLIMNLKIIKFELDKSILYFVDDDTRIIYFTFDEHYRMFYWCNQQIDRVLRYYGFNAYKLKELIRFINKKCYKIRHVKNYSNGGTNYPLVQEYKNGIIKPMSI